MQNLKNKKENLTIHLTPGVLERPTCRFTNDVWWVNLNREGSARTVNLMFIIITVNYNSLRM